MSASQGYQCDECRGDGWVANDLDGEQHDEVCEECDGRGWYEEEQ